MLLLSFHLSFVGPFQFVNFIYSDHQDLVLFFRLLPVRNYRHIFIFDVSLDAFDDENIVEGVEESLRYFKDDGIVGDEISYSLKVVIDIEVILYII